MTYRRVIWIAELGVDLRAAFTAARPVVGDPERLVVAAIPGDGSGGPRRADPAVLAWLDACGSVARAVARSAEVVVVPGVDVEALETLVETCGADLVVAGPRPFTAIAALSELRRRCGVAVLWIPPAVEGGDRPSTDVLCVALGARARGPFAAFLRDHVGPATRVSVLAVPPLSPDELAPALDVAGARAPVALVALPGVAPWRVLDEVVREHPVGLVVLARFASPVIRGARWPAPVLVLPPSAPPRRGPSLPLDVADAVDLGEVVRLRVGSAFGVRWSPPLVDREIGFVSRGRLVAALTTPDGEAELPSKEIADALGVFRVTGDTRAEPVAAIERLVAVVRPGPRPLIVFDAALPGAELRALARARDVDLLAVRMRPVRSAQGVRDRLRAAGLAPRVVDASAVLAEGDASDVGDALDDVRLARVAARMAAAGFPVVAMVHSGGVPPSANGFEVLRAEDVCRRAWTRPQPCRRGRSSLSDRLDAMTGAPRIPGNRVELELDNETARRWLLDAIRGAERTLHLQTYIASDDAVGREIEAALRQAAARGIAVRVLVDSLAGRHGSLGLRNPLLERLAAIEGVQLRVIRPVTGLPSLEDLKRRDHRKLVIADGRVALLGGRNLAHEYYRGFHEVKVEVATPWRQVPWLDAGARVEGPAATALERSFLEAWTASGGEGFEVVEPGAAGATEVRPVLHLGLRDAATLEAYLAIVEHARSTLDVVAAFPLALELQHALLRALRRGVQVRALLGRVASTHGGEPFEGDWASARAAATWMVHSRIDALVAAGAQAFELEVRDMPGWALDLGPVHPHVHAKAMSADGRVCAVGSANLDLTGSYWESEVLLVVEDELIAHGFEGRLRALMARSVAVDPNDPAWQRLAGMRAWLRRWPGTLSP